MIYEFAVEPEVMARWEHFNVLWPDFGVSCGRMLVEFPGSWRKKVCDLADQMSSPVRALAIKSKIYDRDLWRQKMVGPDGRASMSADWQSNAIEHQRDKPFRAIIVLQSKKVSRNDVLVAGEFDRDTEPWKVNRQDDACCRSAEEMLRRVHTLLKHSEEIKLVDPRFDPGEPRWRRPFEAFVGSRNKWKLLEVHAKLPKVFVPDAVRSKYRRHLELAVPKGATLRVFLWPEMPDGDKLHPRFVLTERGGLYFDYGLDEGQTSAETTLVTLLDHEVFQNKWKDFSEYGIRFGNPERFEVEGKG